MKGKVLYGRNKTYHSAIQDKTSLWEKSRSFSYGGMLFEDVIRLRNQKESKNFLNQNYDLTVEMQKEWFKEYLLRENDIYWAACNKQGDVIGTIKTYNIERSQCEQGSTIIDAERKKGRMC